MKTNPQRLAWTVLLMSFGLFLALTAAVPLSIRHYILTARKDQNVILEVQRGPLRVTLAGRRDPVAIAEEREGIPPRTVVATDSTAGRLVMVPAEEEASIVTTVQLYDDTEVELVSARSPRFSSSRLPHEVILAIDEGRARINVPGDAGRETVVEVETPHGTASLREGNHEIRVDKTDTEVTVHYGRASATKGETTVHISSNQRAFLDRQGVTKPMAVTDNLIDNGDFRALLESTWATYAKDVEVEGESGGTVERTEVEGCQAVAISRQGVGHAETGIRQELNVDVHDYSSLRLHLLLRIVDHDVPICGTRGSECPVMVRIDYEDAQGTEQQWLQGFYWQPDPNTPGNPSVCVTCNTRNPHVRVRQDNWYPYVSPNLISVLSRDGQAPAQINTITIYASGHSYHSLITDVELVGQE